MFEDAKVTARAKTEEKSSIFYKCDDDDNFI
jgi:hypothetical protein